MSIDVVLACEILYYPTDLAPVWSELERVVKPEGCLITSTFRTSIERNPAWHAKVTQLVASLDRVCESIEQVDDTGSSKRWVIHTIRLR